MADLYREIAAHLAAAGWNRVRSGKGSHEIWTDQARTRRVTVPRSTKSRHMANEVLKQAGLPKAF
jgi:predicted RNA binding protein YcfA (HicA-like mRNA interferase family)